MTKPRGRDLGLPFPGETGPHNAITDVPEVEGELARTLRRLSAISAATGRRRKSNDRATDASAA